jgi:hypothetical protein
MHIELALPALLPEREALADALRGRRYPALERLLARGRSDRAETQSIEDWLAEGFGMEGPLPAGALTQSGDETTQSFWMRADPVHLRVGRDRMRLMPAAAFSISRDEAAALVATLNRHFAAHPGGALAFDALQPDAWSVRMPAVAASAQPPIALAGADVDDNLPSGEAATLFHALMNEVQMLLHEHPVNEAREARGDPAINSVWFWGGGTLPRGVETRWRSLTGADPSLRGLARLATLPLRAPKASAEEWLAGAPEDGRHLVLIDSLRVAAALEDIDGYLEALAQLEARWFAPLAAALGEGRIGMLTVHVPDAREALSVETTRSDLRRFWRRPKPLASYL